MRCSVRRGAGVVPSPVGTGEGAGGGLGSRGWPRCWPPYRSPRPDGGTEGRCSVRRGAGVVPSPVGTGEGVGRGPGVWRLAPLWVPPFRRGDGGCGARSGGGRAWFPPPSGRGRVREGAWGLAAAVFFMYYMAMSSLQRRRWRTAGATQERAAILRREMTPAEQRLWRRLRRRQLNGAHFRRQHAIGRFIVDFCCIRATLVIEVDGPLHAGQREYDAERTRWLNSQRRYHVLRFTNADVEHRLDAVVARIRAVVGERLAARRLAPRRLAPL